MHAYVSGFVFYNNRDKNEINALYYVITVIRYLLLFCKI